MTSAIGTNTVGTIKGLKRRHLAWAGALCLAVAAVAGGVFGVSRQAESVPATAPAARIQISPLRTDWKEIYYVVSTQAEADAILATEANLRSEIAAAGLELPNRTILAFVVDSQAHEDFLGMMMAEVDPQFVQFIDTRFAPL